MKTAKGKSVVPGEPPASEDTPEYMKACKDIHDHLMEASDHPDTPPELQKAHYSYARKLADLATADQHGLGKDENVAQDRLDQTGLGKAIEPGTPPASEDKPQEMPLVKHLKDVHDHLMTASDHPQVPPLMQKAHYHYAKKSLDTARMIAPESPAGSGDKPELPASAVAVRSTVTGRPSSV